jgi:hypothetical protein
MFAGKTGLTQAAFMLSSVTHNTRDFRALANHFLGRTLPDHSDRLCAVSPKRRSANDRPSRKQNGQYQKRVPIFFPRWGKLRQLFEAA